MSLALTRGANAALTDAAVMIGIGWGARPTWDIDASAFLIGIAGKVRGAMPCPRSPGAFMAR